MKTTNEPTNQIAELSDKSELLLRIQQDFNYLKSKSPLYEITINPAKAIHIKDLQFRTAKYLNLFKKMCMNSKFEYLFVIEYSQRISNGQTMLSNDRLGEHVHLVVHTDLGSSELLLAPDNGLERLICFLNVEWEGGVDIKGKPIHGRADLSNFGNYLTKQLHLLKRDNYHSNI